MRKAIFQFNDYFLKHSMSELIHNYYELENEIQKEVILGVIEILKKLASQEKGDIFRLKNIPCKAHFHFDQPNRKFEITILPADIDLKLEILPETKTLHEIGLIRIIEVNAPSGFSEISHEILSYTFEMVRYAYVSYETVFESKFKELEQNLIASLYDLIKIEIKRADKPALLHHFWLSVTKIQKKGDYGIALMFFDYRVITATIEHLKKNQKETYSPFEILIALLKEEVPDEGTKYHEQDVKEFIMEYEDMEKAIGEHNKYWNAEKAIFGDTGFGSYYLVQQKNFLLAMNYPKSMATDYIAIIKTCHSLVEQKFKENLANKKLTFSIIDQSVRRIKIYSELKDFITSVIAKFGAEMLKPG